MIKREKAVEELEAGFGAHGPAGADLGWVMPDLGVEVGLAVGGEDGVVDVGVYLAEAHDGGVGVGGVVDVVVPGYGRVASLAPVRPRAGNCAGGPTPPTAGPAPAPTGQPPAPAATRRDFP